MFLLLIPIIFEIILDITQHDAYDIADFLSYQAAENSVKDIIMSKKCNEIYAYNENYKKNKIKYHQIFYFIFFLLLFISFLFYFLILINLY